MSGTIKKLAATMLEEDRDAINEMAAAAGRTLGDYLVEALLGKKLSYTMETELLIECRRVLDPVIVRLDELPDSTEKEELKEEVKKAWQQINLFQMRLNKLKQR